MSSSVLTNVSSQTRARPERGHRLRLTLGAMAAIIGTAALLVYGLDYYLRGPLDRPYHPRHWTLRPSGQIGFSLGIFGFVLFCFIFLYPLRRRWKWLGNLGNSRHWFDFHILMGLSAPVVIAFHASFKFHGLAGMAYWIMFAVAASGIAGRYILNQIPRSRNTAELSLQESKQLQEALTAKLAAQKAGEARRPRRAFPTAFDTGRGAQRDVARRFSPCCRSTCDGRFEWPGCGVMPWAFHKKYSRWVGCCAPGTFNWSALSRWRANRHRSQRSCCSWPSHIRCSICGT